MNGMISVLVLWLSLNASSSPLLAPDPNHVNPPSARVADACMARPEAAPPGATATGVNPKAPPRARQNRELSPQGQPLPTHRPLVLGGRGNLVESGSGPVGVELPCPQP